PMKTIAFLKALKKKTEGTNDGRERRTSQRPGPLRDRSKAPAVSGQPDPPPACSSTPEYWRVIPVLSGEASVPLALSPTQEYFCLWNAERLGISVEDSRKRYIKSWSMLPNGHAGAELRSFADLCYGLYQVYHDDNPEEVYEAYRFHSPMHSL